MVVAYAIASYQLIKLALITNEEWITQRGYYEIQICDQPTPPAVDAYGITKPVADPAYYAGTPKTPEQIATCKQETNDRLVAQRSYETKDTTIGGVVRGTFLLILFLTHYPRMMRLENRRSSNEEQAMPKSRIAGKSSAKKKA